ncbi:MAG TPA: DUF5719 family protein [Trebonia sp.]|nr:DUF5719 family protein [Trebonia sp.]
MTRRVLALAAVLVALAAIYVAAAQTQPRSGAAQAPPRAAGTTAAITSVLRACPPPGPNTGDAQIAVVAAPGQGGRAPSSGSAQLTAMPDPAATQPATAPPARPGNQPATGSAPAGAKSVSLPASGSLALRAAPQAPLRGGTAVSASGPMAQGFEAEEASSSGTGLVSCAHPGSDMWFTGAGQQTGAPVMRLYLMNSGTVPASVEVTVLTDAGIQPGLNSAITVAAGQSMSQDIAKYAHGSVVLGVHVQTSSGQVAADLWEGPAKGSGGAWLPQAAAPAKQVVIPGLATTSGAARLFVVVPGSADARVKVTVATAHGPFLPFGTSLQDAPAAAASSFALSSLGSSDGALVLTSNVPITAGIAVSGAGIGAFSAGAAPLTEQGVVAANPAGKQSSVSLTLTAPAAAAAASVAVVPSGSGSSGAPLPQAVQVPAGHTAVVSVRPPAGGQPFAIVITPRAGSGPLYAARVVASGTAATSPIASILPVLSAPSDVALPPARDSYAAISPAGSPAGQG